MAESTGFPAPNLTLSRTDADTARVECDEMA